VSNLDIAEHGKRHGISQRMQAFYAIKLLRSVTG